MNIKWTSEQKELVKQLAGKMTDKDLAIFLSQKLQRPITRDAVRKLRQRLGVRKQHGRGICGIQKSGN